MGNYDFDKDLAQEKLVTQEVVRFLESNGYKILHDNHDNKYDLEVKHIKSGKVTTIEIKENIFCKISGNVAVEYSCRGKASGIETTQSDYYLDVTHYDRKTIKYVIIPVKNLKALVSKKDYPKVSGGDGGSDTRMYLIPKDDFIEAGKVINTISR